MSTTDTKAAFEALPENGKLNLSKVPDGSEYISFCTQLAWRNYQAATEAAKATGTAGEQETHNFKICMYFDNWLISKGFASTSRTEEVDGPMAPAMNWIDAVEAAIEAARQPAPVVVKPWETRMQEYFAQGSVKMRTPASFMADEIIDSRAALAATAAPVLSDEQIDHIARSYFADEHGQTKAKGVIHDALVNARVLRPDHRETLEQIAHFLHNSVRIQQNAPDDYYPATEFDSQLQQAADEIGSILAATNRSQP